MITASFDVTEGKDENVYGMFRHRIVLSGKETIDGVEHLTQVATVAMNTRELDGFIEMLKKSRAKGPQAGTRAYENMEA